MENMHQAADIREELMLKLSSYCQVFCDPSKHCFSISELIARPQSCIVGSMNASQNVPRSFFMFMIELFARNRWWTELRWSALSVSMASSTMAAGLPTAPLGSMVGCGRERERDREREGR
jgi:hypothetical protein